MATVVERWRRGVNAFVTAEEPDELFKNPSDLGSYGTAMSVRPDRNRTKFSNEKTIITSIYNRISVDAASVQVRHIRLDDQGRYTDDIDSGLNNCLTIEANLDQAARHFRQDLFMTLCDEGVAAIVPVDTSINPIDGGSFDILSLRVGSIVKWFPDKVRVKLYNERKGIREEITLPKTVVAIVENPFFAVMNEPNSTLKRLVHKLSLLDSVDEATASGKLDLIIQLPYVIKSEARKQQAQQRRDDIEFQLKGSKYGIAYTDGTEKITQLNRPAENNLLAQIEKLTGSLYAQLGLTEEVMNGTADEPAMLKYWNGTIEPMVDAVVEAMTRTFLTKTARSQRQSIMYFRDPFKLIPIKDIAELGDKFARNEILSSNEIRGIIGFKPSKDPKADQLINSNMPTADTGVVPPSSGTDPNAPVDPATEPTDAGVTDDSPEAIMNSAFDALDAQLSDILGGLGVDGNEQ